MTDAQNSRIEEIVELLKRLPIEERATCIDEHCTSEEMRNEVLDRLEAVDEDFGTFLASPAVRRDDVEERQRRTIGPYQLLQEIGEGGFGIVYMAKQEHPVRRQVALKILKPGKDSREVRARFEAERQALSMMSHPNIATVLDVGTTNEGHSYFVMELVKGIPIHEYCDKHSLRTEERLELFCQVCSAVEHAHQKGVIHRDLKPSNILVASDEVTPVPKVIDFGVAKALNQSLTEQTLFTRVGQMVGTPAYMSPEQAELTGLDVDTRSDVYSLGVLLYELLTGTIPLAEERLRTASLAEIQKLICEEEPPTPSTRVSSLGDELASVAARRRVESAKLPQILRGELDWIVMRALEKDRSRRYQSASAFAADIERYTRNEPVEACPPTLGYRFSKFAYKHRAALSVVATILLILTATTTVSVWQAIRAGKEATRSLGLASALKEEKAQAELQGASWRAQFYGANLLKARHFLSSGNGGRASEALDDCPEDLRGWEWHRLKYMAEQSHPPLARGIEMLSMARFSPDGRRVVSVSSDGGIRLFDATRARLLWTTSQPEQSGLVRKPPAFSPDGRRVVTSTLDWIVIRDASTGEQIERFETMTALAFHYSDRGLLALVSIWEAQPCVFNADDGTRVVLNSSLLRHRYSSFLASAAFRPDGELVATGRSEAIINLWDSRTGARKLTLKGHSSVVTSLAFTPDGKRLVSGSLDRTVRRWDVTSGEELGIAYTDGMVHAVAVSPDGKRFVSGGTDSTITVWNVADGKKVGTLNGHGSSIASLEYSTDGKTILSASADGTVRTWDSLPPVEFLELEAHRGHVECVSFSPDGTRLVSTGGDRVLRIFEVESGRRVLEKPLKERLYAVTFSPDGRNVACAMARAGGTGQAIVISAASGNISAEFHLEEGSAWALDYSPDGRLLAASGDSDNHLAKLYIWEVATGKEFLRVPIHRSGNGVPDLAFSSDGRRIATAIALGRVHIWDAETGVLLTRIEGPEKSYRRVVFSPDGSHVAASSQDGNDVHVWSAESGELLQTLARHSGTARDLAYSPDGRRLFTVGADDTLRVWNTESGEELLIVATGRYPMAVAVSRDGTTVANGDGTGRVRIWRSERRRR